jgi:hypothetical protein
MLKDYDPFIKTLESLGEEQVSSLLSAGKWTDPKKRWASDWLNRKVSLKRDAREEETLSIAKDANRIASEALTVARDEAAAAANSARWAKIAAIIAATAAIISVATTIIMAFLSKN